ncbi:uncharacterized protein [Asterias amurensis]|uniref:uncharacterized protein n=1 Tax=Asterias amurensis TaxID=7602 RepID=UPI003AB24423
MKKLINSTKGDDPGTPRLRDNGEGQPGKTSEFSKKLPLPAIETDPEFPASVLSAATMNIRHKPAMQRDAAQTTTKPKFHRQLSAQQRKADLPRLIPGRCSPPNLPGRHQGPCGDLPHRHDDHRAVDSSTKRDKSTGLSQKHLVNPPWAPCKVVDPTYIGNIGCFDRLPKGLKHLEPVDLCHRHGHHRRLNPLGKAQNDGSQRRSCINLRAVLHKHKVQEKKVIPVTVVRTETSTDDKPEHVDDGDNRNRNMFDIDAESKARPDPPELLKPENSFVSSISYRTDDISSRSFSSVSKEQGETVPSETSQVTELSCQMPSTAKGDCRPQSSTVCKATIPTCKLTENLQQMPQERVEKETLTFSVSSRNSLSADELKVQDENHRNENASKPKVERRGSLTSCHPKGKLRTDEVSKSFSALSSKEKELAVADKTHLKHTMPRDEHRGKVVEKLVCTDADCVQERAHEKTVPELEGNACEEVKTTGQQQKDTPHDLSSPPGATVVKTPIPKPTTSLTQVATINTRTKTDVSDQQNKPDSFVKTVTTKHWDSEKSTKVCKTEIPSHKLLSLFNEVSEATHTAQSTVVTHSKIPVRSLAGKVNEPSTKNAIKQTLPPAFQKDPAEESFGSGGCYRPEQHKLKHGELVQDEPSGPTSTIHNVELTRINKAMSKLKTKTEKAANSAVANSATVKTKETFSKRDSKKPKPIIETEPEIVMSGPDGSQLEIAVPDTDQDQEFYPDLAIGVRLFRTPVDDFRPRVSDSEIHPPNKDNRSPSEEHNEGEHQTLDVGGEKWDIFTNDALPLIQKKSKDDFTATEEIESLPSETVPKRQPVVAKNIQHEQHEENVGIVMDKEKVTLKKPEKVVVAKEDRKEDGRRNGVNVTKVDITRESGVKSGIDNGKAVQKPEKVVITEEDKKQDDTRNMKVTKVDFTPQSEVKSETDNDKNVQGVTEKSELPSTRKVDGELLLVERESLTMYVTPLPCSPATHELPDADGLSQQRSPCRWRINLDANRLEHLLQVQNNPSEDGSPRGRGDWKERPVNYVDPNVPLEDMLTKYFTDHTPLDSAFQAINIVNSYSSSISYNSYQAQERVVAALQGIKEDEVYKHAAICPLASQCADATREFGESLYKAFRRFSNQSRAAQEAMIEYYRTLAEGEITSPEMVKQIKRDGRKLYMVWEGGRYVTRYEEDEECSSSSDQTKADDTTGSSRAHKHNPASDRK